MDRGREKFWATIPEWAVHPTREPMLEALWRIGEPLDAIDVVDVLDGARTMWEAHYHLRVLEELGVVVRTSTKRPPRKGVPPTKGKKDAFEVPFRLKRGRRR